MVEGNDCSPLSSDNGLPCWPCLFIVGMTGNVGSWGRCLGGGCVLVQTVTAGQGGELVSDEQPKVSDEQSESLSVWQSLCCCLCFFGVRGCEDGGLSFPQSPMKEDVLLSQSDMNWNSFLSLLVSYRPPWWLWQVWRFCGGPGFFFNIERVFILPSWKNDGMPVSVSVSGCSLKVIQNWVSWCAGSMSSCVWIGSWLCVDQCPQLCVVWCPIAY